MNLITMGHRYVTDYTGDISYNFTSSEKKCCRTCANCRVLYNDRPKTYVCNYMTKLALEKTLMSDDTMVKALPNHVCSKWKRKIKS